MERPKVYKVGFVGMGFIGRVHGYGHINLPLFFDPLDFRTSIEAVCTGHSDSASREAARFGAPVATTDFRDITENPEIDIVHICSPNDRHIEPLLSAMAHQKHIYCEKPLVKDDIEAAQVEAALADYKMVSQMTLQNRFFPTAIRAKQLIDEGRLGRILEFNGAYNHSGSSDPNAPFKWKLSAAAGGGVIADLSSHIIDLLQYLMGDFAAVSAVSSIAYAQRPAAGNPGQMLQVDAEDSVRMLARLASGATGTVSASKIATGTEDDLNFAIYGTAGALRYSSMAPHYLEFFDTQVANSPVGGVSGWTQIACGQRFPAPGGGFPSPKNSIGWLRGHMQCLYNFMDCVHNHRVAQPDLASGIKLQRLLTKVRQSAASGTWMEI